MLHFTEGNMFDFADSADVMVNTVNCVGVMGKGVALEFKKRYPDMFLAYQAYCSKSKIVPGHIFEWPVTEFDRLPVVLNLATKQSWRDYSNYSWINLGISMINFRLIELSWIKKTERIKVVIPALGCGNGGLNWCKVSGMIATQTIEAARVCEIYVVHPQ